MNKNMKLLSPNATEEETFEFMYGLREEIATAIFLCPIERPDFGPTQVKTIEELEEGKFYNLRYENHSSIGKFVGLEDTKHGIKLKFFHERPNMRNGGFFLSYIPSDKGLVPYKYNNWNPTNWIERIEQ